MIIIFATRRYVQNLRGIEDSNRPRQLAIRSGRADSVRTRAQSLRANQTGIANWTIPCPKEIFLTRVKEELLRAM
eukprot:Pgem_evm1s14607